MPRARSSHAVRAFAGRTGASRHPSGDSPVLSETPLIASRSLGALLGFGSLACKLETCQPTGSWLDREAALLVRHAVDDGLTGLCIVGAEPLALPLALQCARAGLRLLILRSTTTDELRTPGTDPSQQAAPPNGWLAALGARQVVVDATHAEIAVAAHQIADGAGLRLIEPANGDPGVGLETVAREIAAAGVDESILAVPALASARLGAHLLAPVLGVLTAVDLDVSVSEREADAARVLLAREEGLIASRSGAAALAALVRTVREDRARRPRERRFRRDLDAVVVLTDEPHGQASSPPIPADATRGRTLALAELVADPRRLLVEPPGTR